MEFVELPSFTKAVQEEKAEEQLQKLQNELIANPEKGDLIRNTGGFRKVRMPLPGMGKSGGARVIYYYLVDDSQILLAMLYKKTDRDTLSHDQEVALKGLAAQLKG
jgi:hypothetical protein